MATRTTCDVSDTGQTEHIARWQMAVMTKFSGELDKHKSTDSCDTHLGRSVALAAKAAESVTGFHSIVVTSLEL